MVGTRRGARRPLDEAILEGFGAERRLRRAGRREAAINCLGSQAQRQRDVHLIRLLRTGPTDVAEAAIEALGGLKSRRAVRPLVEVMNSRRPPRLRIAAIDALRRIGDRRALKDLIRALDAPAQVAAAAARAAAVFGESALSPLLTALKDSSFRRRAGAVLAVGHLKRHHLLPVLLPYLKDRYKLVRRRAAAAISLLGPQAGRALSHLLQSRSVWVREGGVDILKRCKAADLLIPALRDPRIGAKVAQALGELKARNAVDALISILPDADSLVRQRAFESLSQLGKRAVVPLIEVAREGDAELRRGAARALGQLRDRRAVPTLIQLLHDGDEQVRRDAAFALIVELKDPTAIVPLQSVLQDKADYLWRLAAQAFGHQWGDPAGG